jgi:uncharacterized protein involved in exopolysaccharide biosynthesis
MVASQNSRDYAIDDEGLSFSLRDVLTIVFKRWRLIAVFATTVFTVVTAATLLLPRTYEVSSTLLVNEARAEVPLAPTDSPQLIVNQVTEQDLNSEIEVLRSRQLIEEVVANVAGESPPETVNTGPVAWVTNGLRRILGSKQLSASEGLVVDLQEHIIISSIRKSNVIRVSYQSADPEWATKVVEALVDRYLVRRAERYQSPQAVEFFREQMEAAEARLAEHESALEAFLEEASITMVKGPQGTDALASQKAVVMARLSDVENALGDARVELRENGQEVASLRARMAQEPERIESGSRLHQDATTEEIEKGLAAMRLERDRLLQDFKPDSRYVKDIETQIELAEQRLEEVRARLGVSRTEMNPVYNQLKGDLVRAEAELAGTSARIDSLESEVREHRRRLEALNERAFELEDLRREAQAAEQDYLLYRNKHEEARISAAMDQERFINVTVAQPAQLPLTPVPRGLLMKMVLAMIIGVLGGIGIAFALEQYVDRSFTTGEEVERRLGLLHIASIPDGDLVG